MGVPPSISVALKIALRSLEHHGITIKLAAISIQSSPRGGGGTLGISGGGCAAETLEPLTYTRASSAEFCYPILE